MGRTIGEVIAGLPADRQRRVESRYRELKEEVESLRELRQVAGKVQADLAAALNIKQPSVSKIENRPICISQLSVAMWRRWGANWSLLCDCPPNEPFACRVWGTSAAAV